MNKMREKNHACKQCPQKFKILDELQWQKEENHDPKISKKKEEEDQQIEKRKTKQKGPSGLYHTARAGVECLPCQIDGTAN